MTAPKMTKVTMSENMLGENVSRMNNHPASTAGPAAVPIPKNLRRLASIAAIMPFGSPVYVGFVGFAGLK
jgi:hypothetical protein